MGTRAQDVAALALVVVLGGCSSTTPTVPTGPRPDGDEKAVSVPFPPPPARVEVIPLRRRDTCLWLDGSWDYRGGAWVWLKGAWLEGDSPCFYVPPHTRFESTPAGTALVYSRGQWYEKTALNAICQPPPVCADTSEEN